MAVNSDYLDNRSPAINTSQAVVTKKLSLPASGIALGDNIEVYQLPRPGRFRLSEVVVRTSGSLGAGATVKAQINRDGTRTDLTGSTAAGAASKADSDGEIAVPFDAQAGDMIELLVEGAGVTAAADVTVDLVYSARL